MPDEYLITLMDSLSTVQASAKEMSVGMLYRTIRDEAMAVREKLPLLDRVIRRARVHQEYPAYYMAFFMPLNEVFLQVTRSDLADWERRILEVRILDGTHLWG